MKTYARNILLVLVAIVLAACAELNRYEIQRSVEGNQLSSSFPELKVKVDQELSYLGSSEISGKDTPVHPNERDLMDSTSSYLFGNLDPAGILQKGILIRLTVVRGDPGKARDGMSAGKAKAPLDSGAVKILDDVYDFLLFTSTALLFEEERILFKGSTAPCYLVKLLEKKAGLGNKSHVQIYYFENASSECSNSACDACLQGSGDESRRKQVLGGFDGRSYQAISFMESKKIFDATSKYVKPKDSKKEPADVIPPVTETMGHPESIENRLKVLKDLLDKNLITREDYEKKKAAILEGL